MDLLVGNSRIPLIQVFEQTGMKNVSIMELKHRNIWIKRHAADNIGRGGGREIANILINALTDTDDDVSAIAAKNLGRLGIQIAALQMINLLTSLEEPGCIVVTKALVDLG